MPKLINNNEEIRNIINNEKVNIYEFENSEIQWMLKEYWKNQKKERPKFSNIREEIFYILNIKEIKKANIRKKLSKFRGKKNGE